MLLSPVEKLVSPMHPSARRITVVTQTRRGAAATRSPIRRQAPWLSCEPWLPNRGTNGQNARRPPATSPAGRSVSIASIDSATPMAPVGPRPLVPSASATDSELQLPASPTRDRYFDVSLQRAGSIGHSGTSVLRGATSPA